MEKEENNLGCKPCYTEGVCRGVLSASDDSMWSKAIPEQQHLFFCNFALQSSTATAARCQWPHTNGRETRLPCVKYRADNTAVKARLTWRQGRRSFETTMARSMGNNHAASTQHVGLLIGFLLGRPRCATHVHLLVDGTMRRSPLRILTSGRVV